MSGGERDIRSWGVGKDGIFSLAGVFTKRQMFISGQVIKRFILLNV